ncbi:MAG: isoaspartyl peptidase/L-asparaginase [Oligoflexales bacterium]|nr:isoaspartyl peptidase/L-asparaginase [Oligoflexales bacterium]
MNYYAKILILVVFLIPVTGTSQVTKNSSGKAMPLIKLAIHGGAGNKPEILKNPKNREAYKAVLKEAFDKAYHQLKAGGTSEEAVMTAITILEDSVLFNAGRGSVLNAEADISMDAAIMLGETKDVGSVIGTKRTKNPIKLAQTIMNHLYHNTLTGKDADEFAKLKKLTMKPLSYFKTQERVDQLERAKKQNQVLLDHSSPQDPDKFGTVGAVALDQYGHIAAGTSTGGLANKMMGRVGDSPIIGAGTFADDKTCGISATGKGEEFIRHTIAAQIHYDMLYNQASLKSAVKKAVHETLESNTGGIIAVSKTGDVVLDFNTKIMFRAYVDEKNQIQVEI